MICFSPTWTFDAVLITYIGGVGTLIGPVVGAVFYVLVRERLAVTLVNVHQVIFGILFIAGARLRYHGVRGILPGTGPADLGFEGRINLTIRESGLPAERI